MPDALDVFDPATAALEGGGKTMPPQAPAAAPSAAGPSPADQLMKQVGESQKRQEGILAAEQREKAPAIDAALAANREPGPAPPKLERETEPPKSNMQQQMQEWLLPTVALSALAGAFTRQHATTALNAFAAGVKGLKEGNLVLYDQKLKEWRAANEKAIANNEAALKEYNAAWNNKKLNIDQKMNEIQLISSKYQDQLTYEASAQKNFTLVAQMLQKQENLTEKMSMQYEKMKLQADANEAKLQLAIQKQQMGTIDEASIDKMVERRLAGDKSVLTNMGRGAQGPQNIARFNEKLAQAMATQGISGEDLAKKDQQYSGGTSYQRSAGTQAARVESASNEVQQLVPQAVETSRALPRSKYVPFNKLMQEWQAGSSDPAYNDFIMANFSLINAYARAMNPTGQPRVTERLEAKAEGILSQATSQQAYEVQVNRILKEVAASKKAVAETREGVRPVGELPTAADSVIPPGQPPAGGGGNVIKYDAQGNRVQQ